MNKKKTFSLLLIFALVLALSGNATCVDASKKISLSRKSVTLKTRGVTTGDTIELDESSVDNVRL